MLDGGFHQLRAYGLRLSLEAARSIQPKGYHGSWLRGVLGHALSRQVCIHPQLRCEGCALGPTCAYPQVFKPQPVDSDRLPAYVVHGWRIDQARCDVDLVLLEPALGHAEGWIRGLAGQAGRLDLGGGGPGRLVRVQDLAGRRSVFEDGAFRPGAVLTPLALRPPESRTLSLRLLTPLVSKHRDGDPLFGPLRTRLQRLVNAYGDGERLALPEPPWRVVSAQLRRTVIPRGDANPRQVAGVLGQLHLDDLTAAGARLLAAGVFLHAGGETSLGFGRYTWK